MKKAAAFLLATLLAPFIGIAYGVWVIPEIWHDIYEWGGE